MEEVMNFYKSEIVEIIHKALIISVNKSSLDRDTYDAVRFAWRLKKSEAENAEIVLATVNGIIMGVFIADEWLEATDKNFPRFKLIGEDFYDESNRKKRYGFVGRKASLELQKYYLGKRVSEIYRKKGASNPIKYSWKVKN